MFTFDHAKPDKAAQVIVQRVRDAVDRGELQIGARLPPERELIQQFGYSRAVVREALRLLESEGLIKLHSGRNGGAMIHQPSADRFVSGIKTLLGLQNTSWDEVYEMLRYLEPLTAELAATRATSADIDAMQRTIDMMRQNADNPEISRVEGNRFHILMGEATQNRMLSLMTTLTREIVVRMEYPGAGTFVEEISAIHQKILDAIKANDATTARRRAVRHLNACECMLREQRDALSLNMGKSGHDRARRLVVESVKEKGN